jgi:hypothetical protein
MGLRGSRLSVEEEVLWGKKEGLARIHQVVAE